MTNTNIEVHIQDLMDMQESDDFSIMDVYSALITFVIEKDPSVSHTELLTLILNKKEKGIEWEIDFWASLLYFHVYTIGKKKLISYNSVYAKLDEFKNLDDMSEMAKLKLRESWLAFIEKTHNVS